MTLLIVFVAPVAGRLSDRIGSRWLIAVGQTLTAGSLLLFSRLTVDSSWWTLLPGMIVGGLGMAMSMTPMTAAALGAVPVEKAGVGSGILNTFRQVGLALGIAVMGAILTSQAKTASANGATPDEAFVHGLTHAMVVSAAIAFCGAIVAAVLIRKHRHLQQPALAEAAG
jgi:MFS family permease